MTTPPMYPGPQPGQNPYVQQPPPGQYPGAAPQPKKQKGPWYQRPGCLIPLGIIAAFVVIGIAVGGGDDEVNDTAGLTNASPSATTAAAESSDAPTEDQASTEEQAPAEQQSPAPSSESNRERSTSDREGSIGDTLKTGKADVTASNFRPVSDIFGEYLCTDVSFVNTSNRDIDLNGYLDFELIDPHQVGLDPTYSSETDFDAVTLKPGGTRAGTVCFDAPGDPGDYSLTYSELFSWTGKPVTWTVTL